jgi:hypothetical protein
MDHDTHKRRCKVDPIQMMIADLGQQVAEKAIGLAEWKTRALLAEHSLEEIKAQGDGAEEEGEMAPVVALVPTDDEDETDGS